MEGCAQTNEQSQGCCISLMSVLSHKREGSGKLCIQEVVLLREELNINQSRVTKKQCYNITTQQDLALSSFIHKMIKYCRQ